MPDIKRLLKIHKNQTLFLFGARGVGKSTYVRDELNAESTLWIDLLDPVEEDRFARNPNELKALVLALPASVTHVVIDEIQKLPKLLDVVHSLIESTNKYFILTGSSARKLKYGGANLLAGRAFVYPLFPFSVLELKGKFDFSIAMRFGMLPKLCSYNTDEERSLFLQAYALTYLKEEIRGEQLTKNLDAFRRFLEVAAQCNGKIINYSNLSRDVGVEDKTIKEYFSILEDTLLGFMLEPFQHSFRKRLSQKPKFYFFDVGVTRALLRQLSVQLLPRTSMYGDIFEHFIILECIKLASYFHPEYRFSYLKTKDDAEVDLVVERPGLPLLFIEIKSAEEIQEVNLKILFDIKKEIKDCEVVCFSNEKREKQLSDNVKIMPWQTGVERYFT